MPKVDKMSLVSFSASQMYALVNDYSSYPEFLPGCVGSETISSGEDELKATLVVKKSGISYSFSTHNFMQAPHQIKIKLLNGPFKFLEGYWLFEEVDESCCKIKLKLEFEFLNPLVDFIFSRIFTDLCQSMIEAFKKRAIEIYN